MNNLHSNEKHLADKLQRAPVPDVNRSWEQMRELLDRDMPEPAGMAWSGNRKWWWMGITAGLIMLALWFTQELSEPGKDGLANSQRSTQSETKKQANLPPIDKTSTPQTANSASATTLSDNSSTQASKQDAATPVKDAITTEPTGNTPADIKAPAKENSGMSQPQRQNSIVNTVKPKLNNAGITKAAGNDMPANDGMTANKPSINKPYKQDLPDRTTDRTGNKNAQPGSAQVESAQTVSAVEKSVQAVSVLEKSVANETSTARAEPEHATITANVLDEEITITPSELFNSIEDAEPGVVAIVDKKLARDLRRRSIKEDNRRMSRSGMRGNFGEKEHGLTFAAGLALPQSFALSGQQASAYNAAARSSRLGDYLPAPFFQYHLNPKLFLQTEFHFQSPQYTQRLLLANSSMSATPSVVLEKRVYLEKLYYFNIPFNVYYSPARNLYIGGGLQYSSLLSGVASFEEKISDAQGIRNNSFTRQFKDDSLAAKFSPSEWRYQFDANYYLNRFTLGVRYNQAMRDFVNIRVNSLPIQDRNRAFLIYLRFNIWEERRKD